MRKILKNIASIFLVPLIQWHLRKERKYSYRGTYISILPGVFHPGMFSSTTFILDYLETQNLANQKLLEIGSGTGLISIRAAKANARVTASDLSITALENTTINAKSNDAEINTVYSDLFTQLARQTFDWIIINPPYYPKVPKNEKDLAWFCGENFEYYEKLFHQLHDYISETSQVIIVLTKGCDLDRIFSIGGANGFVFQLIKEKNVFFDEKDFLYRIKAKVADEGRV